jgi:hypothetical protein
MMAHKRRGRTDGRSHDLSDETLQAVEGLGFALRQAFLDLKKRGYRMEDGQLITPKTDGEESGKTEDCD